MKHFLGKSVEEGELLLREYTLTFEEDLMWMGPHAFAFYLQSAINYARSEYSAEDSDFINCMYSTIGFRSTQEGFLLAIDRVREFVDCVIDNYAKFEVDHCIYGDLLKKYQGLRDQLGVAP